VPDNVEDPALRPARLLVEEHLALTGSTWIAGCPGAQAGFARSADEAAQRGPASVLTARGGIRVLLPDDAVAVAYEAPSRHDPLRWHQAVALCVPDDAARRACRPVVTEIGPDAEALRPADTGAVLVDLGLGDPTADVCARTADPAALAALRGLAGQAPDPRALGAVFVDHAPDIVALTAAGRIEVHTGAAPGMGPHARLRPGRVTVPDLTHLPIPHGFTSVLRLRPAHPAAAPDGGPQPFDSERHLAFLALLTEFGDPLLGVAQGDAVAAVRAFREPDTVAADPTERCAVAVALRRLAVTDGTSGTLVAWRGRFGPTPELADPDET
jgi:hypothetical protein